MKKRMHLIISGKVQGVFYRSSACERAQHFGLAGWVKNNPNQTVEITAEGKKENLDKLYAWCQIGPPLAEVLHISIDWQEYKKEFRYFFVK